MSVKTVSVSYEESTMQLSPLVATPKHRWRPSTPCTPRNKTPTTSTSVTPCDRYLPNRSAGNLEFSRFQMSSTPPSKCALKSTGNIPSVGKSLQCVETGEDQSKLAMKERLLALKGQSSENRVLTFNKSVSNQSVVTTPRKREGMFMAANVATHTWLIDTIECLL